MATWRERYQQPSFRDVPFHVRTASIDGGRRIFEHTFPGRDSIYPEDLGRLPERFTIEGYLVGPDYDQAADALIDALSKKGSGELVHPHFGQVLAVCLGYTRTETRDDGGMAEIAMQFVRVVGTGIPGKLLYDLESLLDDYADDLGIAAAADFADAARVDIVPDFVRDGITTATRAATVAMQKLDVFSGAQAAVANLQDNITSMFNAASSLVTAPADLAGAILQTVDSIGDAAQNALDSFYAYRALFGFDSTESHSQGTQSALGQAANNNADIVGVLLISGAVKGACKAITDVDWETYDDAVTARQSIEDAIDTLALTAGDSTYQALMRVRTQLARAVPDPDGDLPRIVTIVPTVSVPSLVLAYARYDDVSMAAGIVARNNVRHPAFVPGGEPLEVLSRE